MTTHASANGKDPVLLDELRATFGDPASLSVLQRVLLVTDGTVTHVIEAFAGEPVTLVKLAQSYERAPADDPECGVAEGEDVIRRRILLRGTVTETNYLFADSIIMSGRLHPRLHHDLVHTNEPIGRLITASRLETFRELASWGVEPAAGIAGYFDIDEKDLLISRTYRVLSQRQPIMVITEKYPASAFRDL